MPAAAIFVAAAIAWVCAVILIYAAAQPPRVGALVERAFIATGLAVYGTVYGLIATNTDFGLAILDGEAAKTVLRIGTVVIVGVLPLAWVVLWVTGRLGTSSHTAALARIESAIERNTAISQGARDDAHVAAEAANSVNEKLAAQAVVLAAQGVTLIQQGADMAEDRATSHRVDETTQRTETIVDETADKVNDIHEATNGGGK